MKTPPKNLKAHYDVVVMGGGIIGACSAYELASQGLDVLLCDKRQIGSGASTASAAMLELQIDAHRGDPFYTLAKASHELFPKFYETIRALTGVDFQFERCGILQLALNSEDATWLKEEVIRQEDMDLEADWWDAEKLESTIPVLNTIFEGAAFYHEDGQVNGEKFMSAMIKACHEKGVWFAEELDDLDFLLQDGKVDGVRFYNQTIKADKIVVAAGAWSDSVLAPLGVKFGIKPIRGQLMLFDTPSRYLPFPIYTRDSGYITPKNDGYTLVGTTVEDVGFDENTSEEGRKQIFEKAQLLLPNLKHKPIRGMTAGLRPGSPDSLPLLGPLESYPNVVLATGHYRNGILLSPITGRLVADLVLRKTPPVDSAPFSPNRFK